jgi:hypothetical protein
MTDRPIATPAGEVRGVRWMFALASGGISMISQA